MFFVLPPSRPLPPQAVLEKHNRELSWQVAMLADGSAGAAAASSAGGAASTPGGAGKGKGGRVVVEMGAGTAPPVRRSARPPNRRWRALQLTTSCCIPSSWLQDSLAAGVGLLLRYRVPFLYGYLIILHVLVYSAVTHGVFRKHSASLCPPGPSVLGGAVAG